MRKNRCENCYWFKEAEYPEFGFGECMKAAPQEKYRVKRDDFCRDFEKKDGDKES